MSETRYDAWKTTTSPTADVSEEQYCAAKAMIEEVENRLEACPGALAMRALDLRTLGRWARYKGRLNAILDHYTELVGENTCFGCGDFSPGGEFHGRYCRSQYTED